MKVLVVMGSDSDLPIVTKCLDQLEKFEIEYECRIMSAHRTPEIALETARTAEEKGFGVIIAAAGKAAHLAGVMASSTTLPIIGIPISNQALSGEDALYSVVQMPPGVPVATVALDGGQNAAVLAAQILALAGGEQGKALKARLRAHKEEMAKKVVQKDEKLQQDLKARK